MASGCEMIPSKLQALKGDALDEPGSSPGCAVGKIARSGIETRCILHNIILIEVSMSVLVKFIVQYAKYRGLV